jgi:hypothetical protein
VSEPKIVIAGTGRAGTTLLVGILSDLGMDTGFSPGVPAPTEGGLERYIEHPNSPRLVKSPVLSTRLRPLLQRGTVQIEHVIIPMRDLDVAVASRVRRARYGLRSKDRGGLVGTRSVRRQREALTLMVYELMDTLATFDIPHTLLLFPRFAFDWEYTHRKLGFLVPDATPEDFRRVIEARYDGSQVRQSPLTPAEIRKSALLSPITFAIVLWERVRRMIDARRQKRCQESPGTGSGAKGSGA